MADRSPGEPDFEATAVEIEIATALPFEQARAAYAGHLRDAYRAGYAAALRDAEGVARERAELLLSYQAARCNGDVAAARELGQVASRIAALGKAGESG